MATATHLPISVSEYLHTSYQPDCDYVDGVVEERNLGELDHAEVQLAQLRYSNEHLRAWLIKFLPEIRVQTSLTRFRIADVCIVSANAPRKVYFNIEALNSRPSAADTVFAVPVQLDSLGGTPPHDSVAVNFTFP